MRHPVLKMVLCLWMTVLMLLPAACASNTLPAGSVGTGGAAPPVAAVPSASAVADTAAEIDFSEFSLLSRDNTGKLRFTLGVQQGAFPWGKTVGINPQPGLVIYNVGGFDFRLYYTADGQTDIQTLRSLQTSSPLFETPRGIKKGDTLESLLAAYDEGLVYQPDPGMVRGDFGICRYVYDELYIYTGGEEEGPYILFYIAGDLETKWITCIEMSLGVPGQERYAADGVKTFPVDYSNIDKHLATDTQTEETICRLLNDTAAGQPDAPRILELLPDINWRLYSLRCKDAPALLGWLFGLDITDQADILNLLQATHGLDGAFADGYASVVGKIFRAEPETILECLALLDDDQADLICGFIAYDCDYGYREEAKDAIAQTRALAESGTLADNERAAAQRLLKLIDAGVG